MKRPNPSQMICTALDAEKIAYQQRRLEGSLQIAGSKLSVCVTKSVTYWPADLLNCIPCGSDPGISNSDQLDRPMTDVEAQKAVTLATKLAITQSIKSGLALIFVDELYRDIPLYWPWSRNRKLYLPEQERLYVCEPKDVTIGAALSLFHFCTGQWYGGVIVGTINPADRQIDKVSGLLGLGFDGEAAVFSYVDTLPGEVDRGPMPHWDADTLAKFAKSVPPWP